MVNHQKKIAVVTGSRAEYGATRCLLQEIKQDPLLELQVIVTGMHLATEYGLTYQDILNDGFPIHAKVESQLSSDTAVGVSKSVGLGVIGFADAFLHLKPDLVILTGDRFEILAAAQAAIFAKIPIAHISGGELTEGAFDDVIRHAISKMSYLHFVGAEAYRKRVIQLGEAPERVFNVGDIGVDALMRTPLLEKEALEQAIDFQFGALNFLVTYHPATLDTTPTRESLDELFAALDELPDTHIIFTKSNTDPDGRLVNQMLDDYVVQAKKRKLGLRKAYVNLGHLHYLSCIKQVDMVIGNSSSGLVEVPYFKKPTVNLGLRQGGRLRAKGSTIDCESMKKEAILAAIHSGLALAPSLKNAPVSSPYGQGNAAIEITRIIKQYPFANSLAKSFYDMEESV